MRVGVLMQLAFDGRWLLLTPELLLRIVLRRPGSLRRAKRGGRVNDSVLCTDPVLCSKPPPAVLVLGLGKRFTVRRDASTLPGSMDLTLRPNTPLQPPASPMEKDSSELGNLPTAKR
mmetsp:Transcript_36531/g.70089  ORF Transcript_36531/g.70089 Transcript_36531/m.70089 type:complete len:117 (-) Transcript_36531:80-430(-)